MTTKFDSTNAVEITDAELVAQSVNGDRDAFNAIIERYKNLVCSLAYSATGNLCRSEDVAQETFVAAWANLRSLREPEKLRSWLCGIVRNHTRRSLRHAASEPVLNAATLDHAEDAAAIDANPSEHAISREEEAILWRSLERIPETYREPLVLFYREHQSIESVAAELDLTEDAVKQRLSRGRKLLQEEVQQFVESALRRTAPNQAFSHSVLASLPLAAPSAAAVGGKATAAKMGFFGAWVLPFIGIFAAVLGQFMVISDTTPQRKTRLKKMVFVALAWGILVGTAWGGETLVEIAGERFAWSSPIRFVAHAVYWTIYLMALIPCMGIFSSLIAALNRAQSTASSFLMKPSTLAASTGGLQIAIFWPLLRQAWIAADWLGAVIIGIVVVALTGTVFYRGRSKTGPELAKILSKGFASAFLGTLLILNLRADVWVAASFGVTIPEAHRLEPIWILPCLSAVLIAWVALLNRVFQRDQAKALR